MKKHLIIAVAVVLAVLLFGVLGYAWSLGMVDEVTPLSAHIEVLEGSAELKKAGADAFQTVNGTSTTVGAGDTVRAAKGGVVEIIWGDQGVSRLEDGSEIMIDSAPDFTADEPSAISLKLTAGRIWSRMVKVLDLDKPMQVKAGDVVATVRGTTYGVELNADGANVVVDDSVVSVDRGDGNDTMIADLQSAMIGNGTSTIVMDSSEGNAWRKQEQEKDYRFDQRYADWVAKREAKRSDRIRKAPQGMVRLGERMRLLLAGKDRKALASGYARRAMALSIADPDQADKALALMQDRMGNAGDSREVQRELNALQSFMNRTDLDGPKAFGVRAPSRGLLKKMREHRLAMAKVDLDRLYREALDIDEDIDELLYMADNRRDASITIASLLTRIDRIDEAAKKLTEQDRAKLSKKTAALRRRLERWFDLKTAIVPTAPTEPTITPTSTVEAPEIPGIPGTKPPVIKPPTDATTTQQVPTTRVYQRLELVPTPSAITVGGRSIVRAYGVRADGGVDDITTSVRFSLVTGALGTMASNVFSASFAGTAKINGTFTDPQGVRTAVAEVLVTEPVKVDPSALVSVAIVTTSPTTVGCGSSIPIKVMGTYGDGSQKDITIMASYGTSDGKLGYATDGKILVFCPAQTSSVVITATVTDRGITKSGSITITVNPDPASGSAGGGRRGYTNFIP
ncbi:MAG: FecR domain-containing protein [Patescibacteria group bacterium]